MGNFEPADEATRAAAFGRWLRDRRKGPPSRTQAEVAEAISRNASYLSRLENGRCFPSRGDCFAIDEVLSLAPSTAWRMARWGLPTYEPNARPFGAWLRNQRQAHPPRTQAEVAEAISMSRPYVSALEKGVETPPPRERCAILDALFGLDHGTAWNRSAPERMRPLHPDLADWHLEQVDRPNIESTQEKDMDTEETETTTGLGALFAAMSKAQGEIRKAQKNAKNPHLRNEYADLEAVWDVVRPVLLANELTVLQEPICEDGRAGVRTTLGHSSGQSMTSTLLLPTAGSRGVNHSQAVGICVSYARRYSLSALLGVTTGEDLDGSVEHATPSAVPDLPHHPSWEKDRPRFCAWAGGVASYDLIRDWCLDLGKPKPSQMDQAGRDALRAFVESDEGARRIGDWISFEKDRS